MDNLWLMVHLYLNVNYQKQCKMSRIRKLKIQAINEANQRILNEQPHRDSVIKIQKFLNAKKITGDNGKPLEVDGLTCIDLSCQTAQAISKYQSSIGVWPAEGVWGPDTMEKMSEEDKKLLDSFGSWFDRLF